MTKALLIIIMIHLGLTFSSFKISQSFEDYNFQLNTNRIKNLFLAYLLATPIILNELGGRNFLLRNARYSVVSQPERTPFLIILEAILRVTPIVLFLFISLSTVEQRILLKVQRNILLLMCLILANPVTFARQTTMLMLVPLISVYLIMYPKLRSFYPYALIITSLFFANPFDRFDGSLKKIAFISLSRSGDFDAFGQFMNAIDIYDNNLVGNFSQLGGPIGFAIPRELWTDKPLDSGVLIAKLNNLQFQNLSCPWLGEAYINFGIFGCIFACLFVMLVLKRINNQNEIETIINIFLASTSFIVLRGSLLQATGNLVCGYILIRLIYKFLDLERRRI